MEKYLEDWITIIEQMNNDNTYKLAWGRAIIECLNSDYYEENGETVVVSFNNIAECMIKYYWNQLFFFKLKQSPNNQKPPVICQLTEELIDEYKALSKSIIPVWYDEGLKLIKSKNNELYKKILRKVCVTLTYDVSWRFKKTLDGEIDIYKYSKDNKYEIIFDKNNGEIIKEYGLLVSKLLNYKWAQLLEKFNYSPKIANKVNGIASSKLRRNNLKKYKEELLKQFEKGKIMDFYTNEIIDEKDVSIDHVIPWSFMYSDDIWNLVVTSKSHNSSKSNSIPSEDVIEKLKKRNETLLTIIEGKFKEDLNESIKNNYLDKFYFECRI